MHLTFHVSQLKKLVRAALVQNVLHMVYASRAWAKEPARVLDHCMVQKGNHAAIKILVEWVNYFPRDATWESLDQIKAKFPQFDPWGQGSL